MTRNRLLMPESSSLSATDALVLSVNVRRRSSVADVIVTHSCSGHRLASPFPAVG